MYFIFSATKKSDENKPPVEQIIYRRDKPIIPGGIQSYEFIQNKIVSPRVKFLTVDPLDAKPGQIQKFTVVFASDFPVSSVSLQLEDNLVIEELKLKKQANGDSPTSRYSVDSGNNLALVSSVENPSSTTSFWSGERIVKNSVNEKYSITVNAKEAVPPSKQTPIDPKAPARKSTERLSATILDWNNTCNIPLGGDWDISETCAVSYVDGADNGNIHIRNNSVMVLDANFGINQSKSVIFQPLGIIALNTKAEIKQGNLWKLRDDVSGTKEVISESSPGSEYVRRYELNSGETTSSKKIDGNSKFTLSPGKQVFKVASAVTTGPKIIQATIDPLDVKVGDTQNLSLVVQSAVTIGAVTAKIETDNGIIDLPLTLEGETPSAELLPERFKVTGGNKLVLLDDEESIKNIAVAGIKTASAVSEPKNLTYAGSWVVKDTHTAKYQTSFVVKDINGVENSILMAWSDPCSTFTAGDRTINTTCSFSDIDGADNGNLTIASTRTVTLQSGANLVINQGKSLIIDGTIIVATGAQIKKTNLWRTDTDADAWASSASFTAQDAQPAGKVRAYLAPNTTDCYDSNSSVWPGNPIYYQTVDRGDGSFDYNCDFSESWETTNSSSAYCENNSTPNPTCIGIFDTGWCDISFVSPGGINIPFCSGKSVAVGCGERGNYFSGSGCDYGQYGGIIYRNDIIQGCK